MSPGPVARARLTDLLDSRPPLARLVVDVMLSNPGAEPSWFVLPDRHPLPARHAPVAAVGPVNGGSARLLAGSGRVPLAHFEGLQGFYCLLVPEAGEIRLHGLLIDADSDDAPASTLDILTAPQVLITGVPADRWLGADPRCDPRADVYADTGPLIAERWPEDLPELPVTLIDARSIPAALSKS